MDKQAIQSKKVDIQQKFQKAQHKWIQMAELAGREYIDFQTVARQCQQELKDVEAKEMELNKPKEEIVPIPKDKKR